MGDVVDDFASLVLVTAVQRALAGDGIMAAAPVADGVLLPFAAKRRFLTSIVQTHGLLPVLRVGLALQTLPPDPAISALVASRCPDDLFERWRRLERFTHSRHQVVLREAGSRHIVAEHLGPPGAPPEPAEDALVLGVLTALLTQTGAQGVTVTFGGDDPLVVFADGVFTAPPPGHGTALWRFAWTSWAPMQHVAAHVDGADVVSRARRLIAGDLGRRWTLGGLASELALSTRSLQRRLEDSGGFHQLLGAARAEAAADLLMNSGHGLSIAAFTCGYADQPHFTRDFKRRTAMTPAAYRSAFACPAPQRPEYLPAEARQA